MSSLLWNFDSRLGGTGPLLLFHVLVLRSRSMFTAVSIPRFGMEDQRDLYLPPLIRGEKFGAFALTEPLAGSDLAGLKTFSAKEENNYVLNGVKAFAVNDPIAGVALVFALTDPESLSTGR